MAHMGSSSLHLLEQPRPAVGVSWLKTEQQHASKRHHMCNHVQLRNAAEQTQALHYHIMNLVRLHVMCLHVQDVVTWDRQVFRASELRVYCMQ